MTAPDPESPTRRERGGRPSPDQRPPSSEGPWRTEGVRPSGTGPAGGRRRGRGWWLVVLLGLLAVNLFLSNRALAPESLPQVSYSFFTDQVAADNVASVTSTDETIQGTLRKAADYPPGSSGATSVTRFETQRPAYALDDLLAQLQHNKVTVNAEPPVTAAPWWQQLLAGFGPTLLIVALLVWFSRRALAGGGLGGLGGIGRSRARRYTPESDRRVTFADVAGIDEVRDEVAEIVDFLRNPGRYRAIGAQIPRGVLLTGPPGTGKTLLARATAGEAEVPFFSISASEFIEMIVGVGASRVRDMFDQAKQVAPAIIFIDELDAIGRARGGAQSFGGHDEREQTLNQVLTEMDGFTGTEGVVVLAATNRPEILDPALLRPGRFDRRVTVSPPDLTGRRAVLAVHTRGVPLAPDVDLDSVAATTPGMVGADLKNLVNEAALLAARRGRDRVRRIDLDDALEKILLGSARGIMLTPEEKRRTAVHESGHALLGMLTPGADPVRKVSIIPRGRALGATLQSPQADRYGWSDTFLRGRITGALGGRAAEEVVYGEITTGAESDLEEATRIARSMVGRWGMSEAIGPVSVLPPPGQEVPFGADATSPATKQLVDREVRRLIETCHDLAAATLREHRAQLDALTARLLAAETLDEDEAYAAAGIDRATAAGAQARGEAGDVEPAPGLPPSSTTVGLAPTGGRP